MKEILQQLWVRAGVVSFRRVTFLFGFGCLAALQSCTPSSPAPAPGLSEKQPVSNPVAAQAQAAPPPVAGSQAVTVTLAKLDQLKAALAAAKGKVVVVNVWATFCVPCAEEMPEFAKFYKQRDSQKVELLSLSADPSYSLEDAVKPFMAEKQIPFPVYLLDEVSPVDLCDAIGAQDIDWTGDLPMTFVVNPSGKTVKTWSSTVTAEDLAAAVAEAAKSS